MALEHAKLDLADWFSVIATAILSGISAAMGWFSYTKRKLVERIEGTEAAMKTLSKDYAEHGTQLAVLKTCQENTEKRLDEIGETTRDTNQNLKELNQTLTQVLLKIQKDQ